MTDTTPAVDPTTVRGLDLPALTRHLDPLVSLAAPLSAQLVAGGRSNPTYEISDGTRSWILRRPPFGLVLATAHDMAREHRVMTALADTAVPVPRTVTLCQDESVIGAPFYVMEKLEGTTLRDRTSTEPLTPATRRAVADAFVDLFADLHEIDPRAVGLEDWGRPEGYLERQLRRWRKQWVQAHSRPRPVVDEILTLLERTLPATTSSGIVHGDVKLDNVMFDRAEVARPIGLLDWEMSTLGDSLADIGLLWAFWDDATKPHHPLTRGMTDLPGFPTAAEMVERYGARRGIEIGVIDWYAALADLKIAIILEQIHVRTLAGGAADNVDDVSQMVDPLLDRAHAVVTAYARGGSR